MGWGEKAIEIRSVETGHLDGVFMHKRAQRLKFLCERNDKVMFPYGFYVFVAGFRVAYSSWTLMVNFLAVLVDSKIN